VGFAVGMTVPQADESIARAMMNDIEIRRRE
jgi:hypothetical protein